MQVAVVLIVIGDLSLARQSMYMCQQSQIRGREVRMFENRCPVCNNELINTAYGRLCCNPACDVFDEYMPFEIQASSQSQGSNLGCF
jgi:hypothetical protein